jgi:GLPGLI family protein
MKRIAFLSLSILLVSNSFAQNNEISGVVVYENVRKVEVKFSGEMAQYESMIPKEQKSNRELIFNSEASLYRNVEKPADEEAMRESAGGNRMVFAMRAPEQIVHTNLTSKLKTEQREFMSRTFLIETNTDTMKWKLTGNQKQILDQVCLEAELVGAEKKTIAWFSPAISVPAGPDGYNGLPGLILGLDIEEGKNVFTAQSIDLKPVDKKLIAKPKDGKKVTNKEFKKIMDEKMEEMKQGGGGTFIIRR